VLALRLGADAPASNVEIQFKLFDDYKNYVARFPEIARYHRQHQPPCPSSVGNALP
jgi:hypothetical protein